LNEFVVMYFSFFTMVLLPFRREAIMVELAKRRADTEYTCMMEALQVA
jgi:hypothetical protein